MSVGNDWLSPNYGTGSVVGGAGLNAQLRERCAQASDAYTNQQQANEGLVRQLSGEYNKRRKEYIRGLLEGITASRSLTPTTLETLRKAHEAELRQLETELGE